MDEDDLEDIFKENIRRGRNRSLKTGLITDGGGGDTTTMNDSSLICLQGIISIKMSVISLYF